MGGMVSLEGLGWCRDCEEGGLILGEIKILSGGLWS